MVGGGYRWADEQFADRSFFGELKLAHFSDCWATEQELTYCFANNNVALAHIVATTFFFFFFSKNQEDCSFGTTSFKIMSQSWFSFRTSELEQGPAYKKASNLHRWSLKDTHRLKYSAQPAPWRNWSRRWKWRFVQNWVKPDWCWFSARRLRTFSEIGRIVRLRTARYWNTGYEKRCMNGNSAEWGLKTRSRIWNLESELEPGEGVGTRSWNSKVHMHPLVA